MEKENSTFVSDKKAQLESALIEAKAKLRTELKRILSYYLFSGIGAIFIVLHYLEVIQMQTWLLVIVWIYTVSLIITALGNDTDKSRTEIERIEALKRIHLGFPESSSKNPEYFDSLVKINVENLAAYYSLVKTHTSQSFKVSLLVSIIGFALITAGLIIGFRFEDKIIGYIASGAGVLTEFISGVLFYLYNKTVRQLKEYHDSLINVQNILLSFKLIESITDEKSKAEMVTKMLEYLVQKD